MEVGGTNCAGYSLPQFLLIEITICKRDFSRTRHLGGIAGGVLASPVIGIPIRQPFPGFDNVTFLENLHEKAIEDKSYIRVGAERLRQ